MENMHYIGLDVHKKTISYCVKDGSGRIYAEAEIPATRLDLDIWTIFTAWIYDHLKPHAAAVKVAHPLMLRAIAAAKKKNDRIDAHKIADCLRCDFLPECYTASTEIRERRRTLRYRNLLVRQAVQMKNKIAVLLMEAAVSYTKQKLHKVGTALTWALEVGDLQRFSSIKKAISYCGLCGAKNSSANIIKRTPLSKQRNKHLQTVLIEAAKMAPRNSGDLAMIYDREKQKDNANRATLAVARKLVAYLVAVDRRQKDFLVVESENRTAA
jgi:transposase